MFMYNFDKNNTIIFLTLTIHSTLCLVFVPHGLFNKELSCKQKIFFSFLNIWLNRQTSWKITRFQPTSPTIHSPTDLPDHPTPATQENRLNDQPRIHKFRKPNDELNAKPFARSHSSKPLKMRISHEKKNPKRQDQPCDKKWNSLQKMELTKRWQKVELPTS